MLEVKNLTFSFYDSPLWRPVSFQCSRGELIHIEGQNGAGKSTCLNILCGLLPGFQGEVIWKQGMVKSYLQSETNGLFLDLDYKENLPNDTGSIDLAEWLGARHSVWKGFPVRFFSTGMRRRLGLLRTLSSGASCILLDEPLMGLDKSGVETLLGEIKSGLDKGKSFIIVSHQNHWLKDITTKSLVLEKA